MSRDIAAQDWPALVDRELGVSDWMTVDQALIDAFAHVTGDDQFIHVDPVRAKAESPYGGTIAHGFLTLSLLPVMARGVVPRTLGASARINYGFDKIRFLAPVPAGARVRARFRLARVENRAPDVLMLRYEVTVEIEGAERPALMAEWLSRIHLAAAE